MGWPYAWRCCFCWQGKRRNKKWDMLKSYLKTYNLFSFITIIIFIGAILFFYFVRHERFLACFCVAFAIVETVKSYSKFKKKQSYLDELRENGLTEKTVNDADFVERWAKTREKGVYKFYVFTWY